MENQTNLGQIRSFLMNEESNPDYRLTDDRISLNGNTNLLQKEEEHSKKGEIIENKKVKQGPKYKNWFFTFNNYNKIDILELKNCFDNLHKKQILKAYVFQEEIGEQGTKHLQGCLELNKLMRTSEFKLPKQIHWEKTRNYKSAEEYCQKNDTHCGERHSIGFKKKLKIIDKLYPWQLTIEKMCNEEPNDRDINWLVDKTGNIGKTKLTKYMLETHNTLCITGGATKDIACSIAGAVKKNMDLNDISIFIFDLPRSKTELAYDAIESVKNGLITSSKYESATYNFNSPHVWIFSNYEPNMSKMSKDRWKLWTVDINKELIKYAPIKYEFDEEDLN